MLTERVILGIDEQGDGDTPFVSPQLRSTAEIDQCIDDLKATLDAVGREAKAAFRRACDETDKIVSGKNSN
jgi:hypothetical protein